MIKYFFRKKKAEWKVKALLYETLGGLLDDQKDLMDFVRKLYTALKDVPAETLQQELITKLADIIHEKSNSAEATGDTANNTAENAAGQMAKNTTKI